MTICKIPFDLVHNDEYAFYKLVFNGKCHFDDFCKEVETVATRRKAFANIIQYMGLFRRSRRLPCTKFNIIRGLKRNDVYEFKSNDLRVYVVIDFSHCDVYVALGGDKGEQKRNIARLSGLLGDFDANNLVPWNGKTF